MQSFAGSQIGGEMLWQHILAVFSMGLVEAKGGA